MLKIVISLTAAAALILVAALQIRHYERIRSRRMRAAAILIRERQLTSALAREVTTTNTRRRLILRMNWKNSGKEEYLFDPQEPITIGRSPVLNQICIRQDAVSARHCQIFQWQGKIYVNDMNSANGTWIRRRFKTMRVAQTAKLQQGDSLIVGDLVMKIHLFLFDTAYI